MEKKIKEIINNSISTKIKILQDDNLLKNIKKIIEIMLEVYQNNKKVILCGNGGSASDALHIEGELLGRLKKERKSLSTITLNSNQATITAIANDYGYDKIFQRQLEGVGSEGDLLIVLSTSGNSMNIINVLEQAKLQNIKTVALLGNNGGKCIGKADISLVVPSNEAARIQESHIMIGHIICELVEENF